MVTNSKIKEKYHGNSNMFLSYCTVYMTKFRKFYNQGFLPLCIGYENKNGEIKWKIPIHTLDFDFFLPIFFEGLSEKKHPYNFLAHEGCLALIKECPGKVAHLLPHLVMPIRRAMYTEDAEIMCKTLKVVLFLHKNVPKIGKEMVQYYHNFLQPLNKFCNKNLNLGDGIEYGQRSQTNIGDLIKTTLNELERQGGWEAYCNIKLVIPTYESCVF